MIQNLPYFWRIRKTKYNHLGMTPSSKWKMKKKYICRYIWVFLLLEASYQYSDNFIKHKLNISEEYGAKKNILKFMHLKNCTNEGNTLVGKEFWRIYVHFWRDYFYLQTSCIDDNYAIFWWMSSSSTSMR